MLNIEQEARIDATLSVGTVVEEVEVTSTDILLQTDNSVNGSLIDSQKLEQLPTNSRNFWQLAQLNPNVAPTAQGDSLANRGGFVVAGIISSNNNYLLDGTDDTDWDYGPTDSAAVARCDSGVSCCYRRSSGGIWPQERWADRSDLALGHQCLPRRSRSRFIATPRSILHNTTHD